MILDDCQFEGDKNFKPKEFFKTYRLRLGMNYSETLMELQNRINELEKKLSEQ